METVYGETQQNSPEFLGQLWEQRLAGVRLVVSDDDAGLGGARKEHFPGVA